MRKLTIAVLLMIAVRVSAQESVGESVALPFLDQVRSAKSAGSAGVMAVARPDAYSHFGNVAQSVFSEEKAMASVSYGLWQPEVSNTNIFSASGMCRVNDDLSMTFGVSSSLYGEERKYDDFGLESANMYPVDLIAGIGAAYKILDYLSFGLALNYVMSKDFSGTLNAFSADVEVAFRKKGIDVSLSACNLGPKVKDAAGIGWNLPMNARLNAGYGFYFGKSMLYGAVQGQYYFGGPSSVHGGVALEYEWNRMISFRAGFNGGSKKNGIPTCAAAGISLTLKSFSVDFAYSLMASGPMKNSLACGVGYSF